MAVILDMCGSDGGRVDQPYIYTSRGVDFVGKVARSLWQCIDDEQTKSAIAHSFGERLLDRSTVCDWSSTRSTEVHVGEFVSSVVRMLNPDAATLAVSVKYLSDLKRHVSSVTWRPMWLTALVVADKFLADRPLKVSALLPCLRRGSLQQVIKLERVLFTALSQCRVWITPEELEEFVLQNIMAVPNNETTCRVVKSALDPEVHSVHRMASTRPSQHCFVSALVALSSSSSGDHRKNLAYVARSSRNKQSHQQHLQHVQTAHPKLHEEHNQEGHRPSDKENEQPHPNECITGISSTHIVSEHFDPLSRIAPNSFSSGAPCKITPLACTPSRRVVLCDDNFAPSGVEAEISAVKSFRRVPTVRRAIGGGDVSTQQVAPSSHAPACQPGLQPAVKTMVGGYTFAAGQRAVSAPCPCSHSKILNGAVERQAELAKISQLRTVSQLVTVFGKVRFDRVHASSPIASVHGDPITVTSACPWAQHQRTGRSVKTFVCVPRRRLAGRSTSPSYIV